MAGIKSALSGGVTMGFRRPASGATGLKPRESAASDAALKRRFSTKRMTRR